MMFPVVISSGLQHTDKTRRIWAGVRVTHTPELPAGVEEDCDVACEVGCDGDCDCDGVVVGGEGVVLSVVAAGSGEVSECVCVERVECVHMLSE